MDVAQLGIQIESSDVKKGSAELDRLSASAKRAETATRGVSGAAAAAGRSASEIASGASAAASALNNEAMAASRAAEAMNLHARAANQNVRGLGAASMNVGNLAAQFQDIAVTSAMAMNPLQIALQQGTQISAVLGPMGAAGAVKALGAAFLSVLSPVSLAVIAIVALVAAGLQMVDWPKLAASALNGLADILQTIAPYAAGAAAALALIYAPAIIGGVISVIALLGRLAVAAVSAAAAMAAANPLGAFILGIAAAVAAANIFREELAQIFGRDVVADIKAAANFIINSFEAAYEDVKFLWAQFPNIMGAAAVGAANAAISAMASMVQSGISLINNMVAQVNSILPEGMQIGSVSLDLSKAKLDNPYAAELEKAVGDRNARVEAIMGQDRVGQFGEAISRGASKAAGALKDLAKGLLEVEDKKKKRGGGKTDEEKYSDIVDGANRRIASLDAEQAALYMTEEAAAALRYETDLLNQAQQKGLTLTGAQKGELSALASVMASVEAATKKTKEAIAFAKDTTRGFVDDFISGLKQGESVWKSFGNAALNALDKIANKLLDSAFDGLFGGGGILGGLFGGGGFNPAGKIGLFASGGYTGGGAAHQAAGIVHGGEYVFSKRATDRIGVGNLEAMHNRAKGYASGGYVAPAMPANNNMAGNAGSSITIDARTTIQASGNRETDAELKQWAEKRDAELPARVIGIVREAQKRRQI